jgi:hypothetical protein
MLGNPLIARTRAHEEAGDSLTDLPRTEALKRAVVDARGVAKMQKQLRRERLDGSRNCCSSRGLDGWDGMLAAAKGIIVRPTPNDETESGHSVAQAATRRRLLRTYVGEEDRPTGPEAATKTRQCGHERHFVVDHRDDDDVRRPLSGPRAGARNAGGLKKPAGRELDERLDLPAPQH